MDKKRKKMSGTDWGRRRRAPEMLGWREGGRERDRERMSAEGGGCQLMLGTDILYESIVPSRGSPLCLSAQLVRPSDNKTTSNESWCGTSTSFSCSCSRVTGLLSNGERLQVHRHAGSKRAQGTRPSMAATAAALAQRYRGKERQRADAWCLCPGLSLPRHLGTDKEMIFWKKIWYSFLSFSSVSPSAKQADRRTARVSITFALIHTHSHTHRQACALSATLFCHLSVSLHLLSGCVMLFVTVWHLWRRWWWWWWWLNRIFVTE